MENNKDYPPGQDMDVWGIETTVDVYGCNPDTIRDADKIKEYVYRLCELIEMKRFGDCTVVNFGEDERIAGFSMTQLIETSLLSGHFANASNVAYLNIFSCKKYNPEKVRQFAMEFFGGKECIMSVNLRK